MDTHSVTVLISSVSKKISLVKAVRKAAEKIGTDTKTIGADFDPHCLGAYFTDQFWEMPLIEELSIKDFVSYCQKNSINTVIPTRDGELSFYSKHKETLLERGIHVMVSDIVSIENCLDKIKFFSLLLGKGFPGVHTSDSIDNLDYSRYVVKERFGAGSEFIGLNLCEEEAVKRAEKLKNPIFQPYIRGDEISADLYVTKTGQVKGVILRTRDLVVNGESQVTTSFRDSELESQCISIVASLNLYGHVMLQLIRCKNTGETFILECNPRFGGASSLSLELGLDSFYWFFLEAAKEDLSNYPFMRLNEEKRMVRYPEDLII